jgi:outer membrane receptor for ferrienterochelin and colicins
MNKLARAACLLVFTCLSAVARAEDTSDIDALLSESVSTTASKSAQASTVVPALTINVGADELRRYGIQTLAEAYNFLGLGVISQDTLSDPEIGSRGVLLSNDAGKHILLLIDGHVTNDQRSGASYHSYSNGVPMELIDHIEVILGPGSVLYGSNAMLGVVNVVTKSAKNNAGIHVLGEAGFALPMNAKHTAVSPALTGQYLKALGKSYRVGAGLGETVRIFGKETDITGQFEYYTLKGPELGWPLMAVGNFSYGPRAAGLGIWGGTTRDSYFEQTPSGYLRVRSGDWQLTLHGITSHASAPYSRVQEPVRDFDDPSSYSDRKYGAFDLSFSRVVSAATSVQARIYGDLSQQSSQIRSSTFVGCFGSQSSGCIHTTDGHARWLGSELQTTVGWLADRSMSTMLGAEGRIFQVGFENGVQDRNATTPAAVLGRYATTGATGALYAQQIYSPLPILTLNVGARWDIDDRFGTRVSPRAAAAVQAWHGGTLKAIYSEAFRAPTEEEHHLTNPLLVLANPGLSPEIVRSAEALLQQQFGAQRLLYGVFRSWWEDVVVRYHISTTELSAAQRAGLIDSSTVSVFQFRNQARVDDYGFHVSYEGAAAQGRLTYGANMTAAYARFRVAAGSQLMTVTPSLYGNVRLSYDPGRGFPVVAIASQMSGRRLVDIGQDPGVRSLVYAPPMLDLRLTFSGQAPSIKNLQYRLSTDYAFTTTNPYAANAGGPDENKTQLIPVKRISIFFGLQYDFK